MADWNTISGFDAWRAELQFLVAEARALAEDATLEERVALTDRLNEFVVRSRPDNHEIQRLDMLAFDLVQAILQPEAERRIGDIAARDIQLAQLSKQLNVESERAAEKAASIRMERATELVESLTESVQKARALVEKLDTAADEAQAELRKRVDGLVKRIQSVRSEIESKL